MRSINKSIDVAPTRLEPIIESSKHQDDHGQNSTVLYNQNEGRGSLKDPHNVDFNATQGTFNQHVPVKKVPGRKSPAAVNQTLHGVKFATLDEKNKAILSGAEQKAREAR